MGINDSKKIVDAFFDTVEEDIKNEQPKTKAKLSLGIHKEVESSSTSVRRLIDGMIQDYSKKLGINLPTLEEGTTKFTELIDTEEGLPFMLQSMSSVEHYMNHIAHIKGAVKIDPENIRKSIIIPVFMVCAGMALRIHRLKSAPEIDISDFAVIRISKADRYVDDIITKIESRVMNNRQKWISFLCYDAYNLILNVLSSIISGQREPLATIMFDLMAYPVLFESGLDFMSNMTKVSVELDKL